MPFLRTGAGAVALCALTLAPQAHAQIASVDSVIVTASPNPEDPPVVAAARARLSETPGAVAVISSESYATRFALGAQDLLRDVPGVYVQKKWGGDARIAIRGSGIGNPNHNRGTLIAQDGIPFNEADGYGDSQMIDPLIARFTEVYKGGNALRFGGALLGGAINMVTPTGRNAGSDVQIRADGGAYGMLRGHGELALVSGDWDLFTAVTATTVDGWRQQSSAQTQYLTLNGGRRFGEDREVRLVLGAGLIHQEIAGSVSLAQALTDPRTAAAANLANNYQRDQRTLRGALQTRWRLNASTVFEGGLYATWKDLDHPIFQVIDQQSRNWGAFGRLDWEGSLGGHKADAFVGAYLRKGDLDANQWVNVRGEPGARTARSRQNAGGLDLFAEGRWFASERLALVAGGSYGRAERDYQAFRLPGVATTFDLTRSIDYDWFSPRVGLLWQDESGVQAYANLTRSVEPPNFSSLSPTAAGFSPLKPQEAWTAEVGTRGRRGALVWDITLYRAELDNELLNYIVNPGLGIPAATFNADRTVHQGLEAGLDWTLAQGLRLRQTYSWSDFRFKDDVQYANARLPVVPQHYYRAELRYQHASGWFVAPGVEWQMSDAFVDYANTLKSPAFAVANLGLGWSGPKGVSLFLDIRNLFDERYVATANAITDARVAASTVFFPGDGRSAYAGVTLKL